MPLFPLLVIAAAFWGQTPACGQPTITQAELRAPVVGVADLGACSITLTTARQWEAGEACMVVVHEFKHLLGYYNAIGFRWPNRTIDHSHSPDPEDLMYPVIRRPVWPCKW